MNLKEIFNNKLTENGDIAYNSTLNKYLDLIFRMNYYRRYSSQIPKVLDKDNEFDVWLARLIRDCRKGFGEREIGRKLFTQIKDTPVNLFKIGRADDLFYVGHELIQKNEIEQGMRYWNVLYDFLTNRNDMLQFNIRKWLPRERGNNTRKVKLFRKKFNLTSKEYRKLIKNEGTVESILRKNEKIKDYSKIPSLSMLKHIKDFERLDYDNFMEYKEDVASGKKKINTKTLNPVNLALSYEKEKINGQMADLIFKNIEKVKLGKILPIIDNSGSMLDMDNYVKARAIGHYVAKCSNYMNNHVVTFSSKPRLLELSDNYEEDMKILDSFNDWTNTDFGKVMKLLSKIDENLPDFLLVLSDMEFDLGSNQSKDKAMKILKKYNPDLKIIWWNFNLWNITTPETDKYGNIFLSGYNPIMLKYLQAGFNGIEFIETLVIKYKEKMKNKLI